MMKGACVEIQGKEFIVPNGYPKFGFFFDENSKRYAIANMESKEITESFVDDVIYSEVLLDTWTSDYVVVRIRDKYYLADNNGNCFLASDEPFIICRNVFVSGDKSYIITKNRVKKECENGFDKMRLRDCDVTGMAHCSTETGRRN